MYTGVNTFSGAKAKPESVIYYNNNKYSEDVPDQIQGRVRQRLYRKMASVFYNILDLAGIKEQQQQESLEESPAAADRGAEVRIHGGERSRSRRHKVGSSGSNHRNSSRHSGSAGLRELQTEPNVGHLKCHKPVCGNCARRAEVICRDCDQGSQQLFVFVLDQLVYSFFDLLLFLYYIL